jgi:hypothetical protein
LALVLEASKWLAWRQCQQAFQERTLAALMGSGLLFFVLLAMSIASSSLQLHNSYLTQKEGALHNSARYQNLSFQIEQQRRQIAALMESAQNDLKNGYRHRAQNILKQDIVQSQNVLGELVREQSAGNIEVQDVPLHSLMHGLSRLCGRNMELILCFVLGGLLDIVLAFLFLLGNKSPKMYLGNIRGAGNNLSPAEGKKRIQKKLAKPVLEEISSGDLGNVVSLLKQNHCSPTVRAIKDVAKIGTRRAQALLESMAKEGLLVRRNLRYQLA